VLRIALNNTCVNEDGPERSSPIGRETMAWTTPTLVEICVGLEINGYLPAEF
jgi:coenzyme PQQ precursor peptide PqqA